jgi:hypothetical protein
MKELKVKILECDRPTCWYANKIGDEFTVIEFDDRHYEVIPEFGGKPHYVAMRDAEIIS